MSFARRNALLRPGNYRIAFGVIVFALLLVAIRVLAPGVLVTAATPLWKTSAAVAEGFHFAGAYFYNPVTLQHLLDEANAKNNALANENAALHSKVGDLVTLLGSRTEPAEGIVAGVLARAPVSPYDSLIVDEGSQNAVSVGSPAFGPGGIPIGVVSSVTNGSSRIALYSAPGVNTEGWIGEDRLPITMVGEGAGAFEATMPRDAKISEGDAIFIPGPGAVPFATILKIEVDPSSPLATVRIRPLVNPFSLTWVTITPNPEL